MSELESSKENDGHKEATTPKDSRPKKRRDGTAKKGSGERTKTTASSSLTEDEVRRNWHHGFSQENRPLGLRNLSIFYLL